MPGKRNQSLIPNCIGVSFILISIGSAFSMLACESILIPPQEDEEAQTYETLNFLMFVQRKPIRPKVPQEITMNDYSSLFESIAI